MFAAFAGLASQRETEISSGKQKKRKERPSVLILRFTMVDALSVPFFPCFFLSVTERAGRIFEREGREKMSIATAIGSRGVSAFVGKTINWFLLNLEMLCAAGA